MAAGRTAVKDVHDHPAHPDLNAMGKGTLASTEENRKDDALDQAPSRRSRPRDKESQTRVGDALRSVYREAIDEPVPQDFLDMLDKLS